MIVRRIGFGMLAIAAATVFFVAAPESVDTGGHAGEVASIEAEDDLNNASAEGAPQQAVVNGWTTNRYLGLLTDQMDDQLQRPVGDPRLPALLLVLVLGACLHWGTSDTTRSPARTAKPGLADMPARPDPAGPRAPRLDQSD
ncbi:hypothetical protein [Isoptericola hypogeus]